MGAAVTMMLPCRIRTLLGAPNRSPSGRERDGGIVAVGSSQRDLGPVPTVAELGAVL